MRRAWSAILLCTTLACKEPPPEPEPAEVPCLQNTLQLSSSSLTAVAQDGCGRVLLDDFEVVADGAFELELFTDRTRLVPTLRALEDGSVFRALHFSGRIELDGDGPIRFWRQGYESASASGGAEPAAVELDADGLPVARVGGFGVESETPGTSWWAALVGRQGGPSAILGAHGARVVKVVIAYEPDGTTHVVWGGQGEAIPADTGERVFLDPLFVGLGPDPGALWQAYADVVAEETAAVLPTNPPPVGWDAAAAWPGALTEARVRDGLAEAVSWAEEPDLTPLTVLHVGQGWARDVGDWQASEDFPSGLEALASDIAAEGLLPGLWLAPFVVSREAPTYVDHPDWWVRDASGVELDDDGDAILDVTHPDAAAWLSGLVAERVGEGWRYLELDRLSAGAREGRRSEDVTGLGAYGAGLALVRDAAGPNTWLLASGAPMLPSAGLVDSYRVGSVPVGGGRSDPTPDDLGDALTQLAARGFTHGSWWWADPGPMIVRAPLDADRWSGVLAAQVASGGTWMLGDPLSGLDPIVRDSLLQGDLTGARGAASEPESPLSSGLQAADAPRVWHLDSGWTVLVNPTEESIEVDGPGGVEMLTGQTSDAGQRSLGPGMGEVWR